MAKLNDLTGNRVQERKRQVRTYGTKTDLPSSSVDRGDTHWMNGSRVSIDGLLNVDGTATVSGTLNASGSINLSGSTGITGPLNVTGTTTIGGNTNITGELNVTGPTTLDGDTDIGGLLDITGKTTIRNDLELLDGGLFKAGKTKIEPTGKATFGPFVIDPNSAKLIEAPGGYLFSNGTDHMGLAGASTSSVNLSSIGAILDFRGVATVTARAGAIDLTAPDVNVSGKLNVAGISTLTGRVITKERVVMQNTPTTSNSGLIPNVHMDSNGFISRTIWTP